MMSRLWLFIGFFVLLGTLSSVPATARRLPQVLVETDLGSFIVRVETKRAPLTGADFLRNVDERRFDGGRFYRVMRPDNDPDTPKLSLVQGGVAILDNTLFPPLAHETTKQTGVRHLNGTLSVAREVIGTGRTAQFFITIGAQPSLDYGGPKRADGQGFAAFARVVRGMDVVRRIWLSPTDPNRIGMGSKDQMLVRPVIIISMRRFS